jgi:hypothetical protein
MEYARADLVKRLRHLGFQKAAEEAERLLPDPVDVDEAARVLMPYGVTHDELISRMGGSP